jgi:hypothetical protein
LPQTATEEKKRRREEKTGQASAGPAAKTLAGQSAQRGTGVDGQKPTIGEDEILKVLVVGEEDSARDQHDRGIATAPPQQRMPVSRAGGPAKGPREPGRQAAESETETDSSSVVKTWSHPGTKPERASHAPRRESVAPETDGPVTEQEKPGPRVDAVAGHRHAQSVTKGISIAPAFVRIGAALVVVAALIAGGWWIWPAGPVHPEARYLPEDCDLFMSLNWQELVQTGFSQEPPETPGLTLARRCSVFLGNAKLQPGDIERINAGRLAGADQFVVVYRLTRSIDPEEIMGKKAFKKYDKDEVRGKPVYTLAGSAIAFPEEKLIVNGQTELVRSSVRRRGKGFSGPLCQFLETVDFSATCVVITPGLPPPFASAHLENAGDLATWVKGAVDSHRYGQTIRFLRSLRLGDERAAGRLQQSLQQSLAERAEDPENPEAVRQLLGSVQVSSAAGEVRIQLTLDADQLSKDALEGLKHVYD